MNEPIPLQDFDAIIFDLGGVILELSPRATIERFSTLLGMDAQSLYTQARQDQLFDQIERGEITETDFRDGVCGLAKSLSDISPASFDDAWNAMLGAIPDENLLFLNALKQKKRTFLLSNTNSIHIRRFLSDYETRHEAEHGPWNALFEQVHYSHDLKMRKPEARIFSALIEQHQLSPERTVFIDDNHDNIQAARSLGLIAVHHPTNAPLPPRFL
jgi:putative hydrolase of the HAD superfamily